MVGPAEHLFVRLEQPGDLELLSLLSERDAYLSRLYPERGVARRMVEATADQLALYGLLQGGQLVAVGGLIRHSEFLELKKLFVAASARRGGVGRRLLDALEAEAETLGCNRLRLEVGVRQAPALHLYKSAGWTEIGPFPPYHSDPMSCFMEKQLRG
jgi:putative acetyltransferase